jgi:hypothetical protein
MHGAGAAEVTAHDEPAGQELQNVWFPKEYLPGVQNTGATEVLAHEEPAGQGLQNVAFPKEY